MALSKTRDGKVLVIDVNRADEGNALSKQLQRELVDAWQELEDDDSLTVGVLTGGPRVFSIGHDRQELLSNAEDISLPLPEEGLFPFELSKPVIAAVEGPCYGLGFELALSCDLRIGSEASLWGFPDQNLFVQFRVASVLLQRMTFSGGALQLLLAGGARDAEEMMRARILNQTTPNGEALSTAVEVAKAMAASFGSAAAFKKQKLWNFSGLPIPETMRIARTAAPA